MNNLRKNTLRVSVTFDFAAKHEDNMSKHMQNLRIVQTCANLHAEQEQQTRQYHPGLLYEYGVRPEQRERLVYCSPI